MNQHKLAVTISEILRIRDTFSDPILVANFTTPLMEQVVNELTEEPNPYIAQAIVSEQSGERGLELLKHAIKCVQKKESDVNND